MRPQDAGRAVVLRLYRLTLGYLFNVEKSSTSRMAKSPLPEYCPGMFFLLPPIFHPSFTDVVRVSLYRVCPRRLSSTTNAQSGLLELAYPLFANHPLFPFGLDFLCLHGRLACQYKCLPSRKINSVLFLARTVVKSMSSGYVCAYLFFALYSVF